MARHHRKSHRKAHRKVHRKSRRQSRKQQRGGSLLTTGHGGGFSSCAALPMNRESFAQRGGEAPYVAAGGADYLLDAPTRIQAQVGSLDAAFAELPSAIPRQAGGFLGLGYPSRRSHRSRSRRQSRKSRKQRGGMSPFGVPGMLLDAAQYANDKTNPQFHTEGSVNPHYGFFKGAQ